MTIRTTGGGDADTGLVDKLLTAEETKKPAEVKAPTAPAEPKPLSWEESVAAAGLTPEQAYPILDDMLGQGYYEVSPTLYRGRLPVTLRTRDAYVRTRLAEALDLVRTNDPYVHSQLHAKYSLAGSLVRFGKTELPVAPVGASREDQERCFSKRLEFVDSLADPILNTLYNLLSRFDARIYAVLNDGAPSGF